MFLDLDNYFFKILACWDFEFFLGDGRQERQFFFGKLTHAFGKKKGGNSFLKEFFDFEKNTLNYFLGNKRRE